MALKFPGSLNSAAETKALGVDAKPETMVDRLLPGEQPREIEPGGPTV